MTTTQDRINAALGDLMIGEKVTVDTHTSTVTGRVAEVGDHSIWLYDHTSDDVHHDREWRAFRRSVTGLELLEPPPGWTRAEVDQAVGRPRGRMMALGTLALSTTTT